MSVEFRLRNQIQLRGMLVDSLRRLHGAGRVAVPARKYRPVRRRRNSAAQDHDRYSVHLNEGHRVALHNHNHNLNLNLNQVE